MYQWKGAKTLLEAARLSGEDILFVFVGGTKKDIGAFKSQAGINKNILVAGHQPYQEIPFWLKAADLLVLPNSGEEDISRYWTSPMKMFEYMASGQPIVASDLPSLREVLNENNAVLVEPDNPKALAEGINKTLKNSAFSANISARALKDVQKYSWINRAKNIYEIIRRYSNL